MIAGVALAFTIGSFASFHEADCVYCKLPLVQNTADQDNEVVVKFGNKRIEYRCVFCILKDEKRYKSDLIVYAPSETVGEPVILQRKSGKWIAPDKSVFLLVLQKHEHCAAEARSFSGLEPFQTYATKLGLTDAKPLTLSELLKRVAETKEIQQ